MSVKNAKSCLELVQESEERFRIIAENSLFGMFLYQEYFIYVNQAFADMTGYSIQELLKMHPWDLVDEKNKIKFKQLVQRRIAGEMFSSVHNDALLIRKNEELLHIKISVETVRYKESYAGMGIAIDISDIMKKNQVIKVLIQALSQSDDIVFITNVQGNILYVNNALVNIYGYTEEEVLGQTPRVFKSGKQDDAFYKELWEKILSGKNYHQVIINRKKNGELIYADTKITPVENETTKEIEYFVVNARDITSRIKSEEKLKQLATIDPLTQIPNRYQINEYFDEFIARKERIGQPFSVLIFDIDHFKKINDTYGHPLGDFVLKSFSRLVMENIRLVDKFGRWGGEEFLLLLDGTGEHEAMRIGQKLNTLVAEASFGNICITVSVGVTEYRDNDTKEQCLNRADNALYAAKNLGRNRVVFN